MTELTEHNISEIILDNGRRAVLLPEGIVTVQRCTDCGYNELDSEQEPLVDESNSSLFCPECGANTDSTDYRLNVEFERCQ